MSRGSDDEQVIQVVTAIEQREIPLKEAAVKYGVNYWTLSDWLQNSVLKWKTTRANPGSRPITIIDEHELLAVLESPPRKGVRYIPKTP